MHLTVRENALKPPVFRSSTATWMEIRDEEGYLVLVVIFPPGNKSVLVINRKDQDFAQTISNFGIPLQEMSPVES